MCLGILHIFSDLEGVFVHGYLRKLDTDDACIFDVVRISEEFVQSMHQFKSEQFDSFLGGLSEDENGNIKYEKDDHSIMLNYTYRQPRNAVETKVSQIQNELTTVKEKCRRPKSTWNNC